MHNRQVRPYPSYSSADLFGDGFFVVQVAQNKNTPWVNGCVYPAKHSVRELGVLCCLAMALECHKVRSPV